jgi:hypothetical protein
MAMRKDRERHSSFQSFPKNESQRERVFGNKGHQEVSTTRQEGIGQHFCHFCGKKAMLWLKHHLWSLGHSTFRLKSPMFAFNLALHERKMNNSVHDGTSNIFLPLEH